MKTSLLCLLAVAVLALAVPLVAQTEQTVTATIVSSTPTQIVAKTSDGRELTFTVDAQSTVPASLAAGNPVTVVYHDMGGGTLHAARVTVSAADTMPTTPTTTTGTTTTAPREPMPENTTEPAPAPKTRRMPATASPLPLIGLAGLLSLTAGLGLRAVRRSA